MLMDMSSELMLSLLPVFMTTLLGAGMIGVGLGAGAIVGSGVWVAPGRSVPAGAVLASTQGVVTRWPPPPDSGVRLLTASS